MWTDYLKTKREFSEFNYIFIINNYTTKSFYWFTTSHEIILMSFFPWFKWQHVQSTPIYDLSDFFISFEFNLGRS